MLQINASIAQHQKRIWCAYRTQHLHSFDAKSYITELDQDFEPISSKPLITENGNTAFEDIRLFSIGDVLVAFYNYHPVDKEGKWRWQYAVGFGIVNIESGFIENQVSLRSLACRYHEKNWTPYVYDNQIFMITDFDPSLRIIKIGSIDGKLESAQEVFRSTELSKGWEYGEIRGGTPLIAPNDTLDIWQYGFIHSFLPNHKGFERYYFFTAVRFNPITTQVEYHPIPLSYNDEAPDEDYILLWKWSNRMAFKVIFPIGIMNYGEGVIVSFGKDDVSSYTEYYSWNYIVNLFKE